MANSDQLTAHIRTKPNPLEEEYKIFLASRYFVAQVPATPDVKRTEDGLYKGCTVVPGPKADKRFSMIANVNDFEVIREQLYIRFTNSKTTDGADHSVGQALYTVMTDTEADEYEVALCKQYPERCKDDNTSKPK